MRTPFNTLSPTQKSRNFVSNGPLDYKPALFREMAWRLTGDKPLSEPMITQFTRLRWANEDIFLRNYLHKRCPKDLLTTSVLWESFGGALNVKHTKLPLIMYTRFWLSVRTCIATTILRRRKPWQQKGSFHILPLATHYDDVIMTTIASQITSLTVVYSVVYSGADQRNIKVSRHWPLCGEFTGTGEFPAQRASYAENVSIWWRHHGQRQVAMVLQAPGYEWFVNQLSLFFFQLKKKKKTEKRSMPTPHWIPTDRS